MPPPTKWVMAMTYRLWRDSPDVAKLYLRLITESDARYVGDSHPSCLIHFFTKLKVYSSMQLT